MKPLTELADALKQAFINYSSESEEWPGLDLSVSGFIAKHVDPMLRDAWDEGRLYGQGADCAYCGFGDRNTAPSPDDNPHRRGES